LIEAGLMCMPLIHEDKTDEEPAESAYIRLGTIASKLRVLPASPETTRALGEFEKKLAYFAKAKKGAMHLGIGLIVVVVVVIALIVWRAC
jgi:hypothetical protein